MSKYKVGDKVLLECVVDGIYEFDNTVYKVSFCRDNYGIVHEKWLSNNSKTYSDGLADAWELARQIVLDDGMECDTFMKIFGTFSGYEEVLRTMTPQEALAKIEAYEKSYIEIGDVVDINGNIAVVTSFGTFDIKNDSIYVLLFDGVTNCFRKNDKSIKKTGRHIDISSILEQIRGNE